MILALMSISCILTAKFANIDAVYSDLLQCSSGHLNDSKAQISQILITEPKRCCIIFTLCLDSCPLGVQCWSMGWPSQHIHYLANIKAALRIFKRSEKCWQVLQYRKSVYVSSVDGGTGAPSWAYTGKVPCLDAHPPDGDGDEVMMAMITMMILVTTMMILMMPCLDATLLLPSRASPPTRTFLHIQTLDNDFDW